MARRRSIGDGNLATALTGLYERGSARLVEYRLLAVQRDLRPFFDTIGWRGMLWIGVLPALSIIYVRHFVKEPEVWVKNRQQQRAQKREVRAPLIKIFQRGMLANTLLACWWMASNFVLYYSIWSLFATHLQQDLKLTAMGTAVPFMLANILSFLGMCFWGWTADIIGRRWAMIIPAAIAIPIAPLYLFTGSEFWITVGFGLQGAFGGALYSQLPSYLAERFPTEVRATASAFCYHQGAIFGGLVAPILAYLRGEFRRGLRRPDAGRDRCRRRQRRRLAAAQPGDQGHGFDGRTPSGLIRPPPNSGSPWQSRRPRPRKGGGPLRGSPERGWSRCVRRGICGGSLRHRRSHRAARPAGPGWRI